LGRVGSQRKNRIDRASPPTAQAASTSTSRPGAKPGCSSALAAPLTIGWTPAGRAVDPRLPESVPAQAEPANPGPAPESEALEKNLRDRLKGAGKRLTGQEEPPGEKFLIVSRAVGGGETQWVVDAGARTITVEIDEENETETDGDEPREDDVTWSILGSPETWRSVLDGRLNLHAALRHNDLRYCPLGSEGPLVGQARVTMLGELLGLSSWAQADKDQTVAEAVAS
jgi:hypothetical protein